jgi:hypothetical protein
MHTCIRLLRWEDSWKSLQFVVMMWCVGVIFKRTHTATLVAVAWIALFVLPFFFIKHREKFSSLMERLKREQIRALSVLSSSVNQLADCDDNDDDIADGFNDRSNSPGNSVERTRSRGNLNRQTTLNKQSSRVGDIVELKERDEVQSDDKKFK